MVSLKNLTLISSILYLLVVTNTEAQQFPENFNESKVIDDTWGPIAISFSADGRELFFAEKAGKIFVANWNGTEYSKQFAPVIDISDEVSGGYDMGMMSFCLDPNFEQNHYIYLFYIVDHHHLFNAGTPNYDPNRSDSEHATIGRVTRYTLQHNDNKLEAIPDSRKILLGETPQTGIPSTTIVHVGGTLMFGTDGTLLLSTGDNASFTSIDKGNASETFFQEALNLGIMRQAENVGAYRAQLLNSMCGKILRIDPNTGDGIGSNPFYDAANPRSAKSRVWALGFRNPFRMTLKPNTGSPNPADANPGALVVSDVGYVDWEDLHLVEKGGQNAGWPIYEGLEQTPHGYNDPEIKNLDEPNEPSFVSLCKQPNDAPMPNNAIERKGIHSWPILTWSHGADATKVWSFENGQYNAHNLGSDGSMSTGSPFSGNCISAGVYYTGNSFPSQYQNAFFVAEYDKQWIRTVDIHEQTLPHPVHGVDYFVGAVGNIVDMKINPLDGSIFYVDFVKNQIRKISYGGNLPPIAKIETNKTFGNAPLTVQFDASKSTDPEGTELSYFWDFSDGTNATTKNPQKTFEGTDGQGFDVWLTVTDAAGLKDRVMQRIGLSSNPPTISITYPANNSKYVAGATAPYAVTSSVTDANVASLRYEWNLILRHNTHEHTLQTFTQSNPTLTITGAGCDGDTYYYLITAKAINSAGLVAQDSVKIYPDCPTINCQNTGDLHLETWLNVGGTKISDIKTIKYPDANQIVTMTEGFEAPSNLAENFGAKYSGYLCVPVSGEYTFYIASDDDGELYLSTSNNPLYKSRIAYMGDAAWTEKRVWDKGPTQQSAPINLIAGKKYYIEAIYKEALGRDNLAIGWKRPFQNNIEIIPPSAFSATPIGCVPNIVFHNCPAAPLRLTTESDIAFMTWYPKVTCDRCEGYISPINLEGHNASTPLHIGTTPLTYTATCQGKTVSCSFDVIVERK